MWEVDSIRRDPLLYRYTHRRRDRSTSTERLSHIVSACVSIHEILETNSPLWSEGAHRTLKVGIADLCARHFRESKNAVWKCDMGSEGQSIIRMEGLEEALNASKRRNQTNRKKKQCHPYILERSDFYCGEDHRLHIMVRLVEENSQEKTISVPNICKKMLETIFVFGDSTFRRNLLEHLSGLVLQQRLRSKLTSLEAIAFVANGSILPRKSGTSDAPMASPPAVPFRAPSESRMFAKVSIDVGSFAEHLPEHAGIIERTGTTIVLSGLIVPKGITLICGGGYHGKSTLLQAIAVGQYDKIPGDGRELCVSLHDSVTVRAEDGRYVNNCNISAFISNLPTPPGVTTPLDTGHFSTRDSSGSTSQASNVAEAIELKAQALLVDEDISAANFMARDGRMRALVMDESITPLLYRVNGLYNTQGISTVVVVGGVGDWLDVPHQVILLDKYVVSDATAKAQSISRQFSYGHVQYAGRGVVHRLEWDRTGTPFPRRPNDCFSKRFDSNVVVSLLEGGRGLTLYKEDDLDADSDDGMDITDDNNETDPANDKKADDDEEEGYIDASRLEQLLGKQQLFAAGLCAAWMLQRSPMHPQASLTDLLELLDEEMDKGGGMSLVLSHLKERNNNEEYFSKSMIQVVESVGYLERPRNFEIGQVLTRMRGIRFDELPVEDDGSEEAARLEAEKRKKALAEIWAKRRTKKKVFG